MVMSCVWVFEWHKQFVKAKQFLRGRWRWKMIRSPCHGNNQTKRENYENNLQYCQISIQMTANIDKVTVINFILPNDHVQGLCQNDPQKNSVRNKKMPGTIFALTWNNSQLHQLAEKDHHVMRYRFTSTFWKQRAGQSFRKLPDHQEQKMARMSKSKVMWSWLNGNHQVRQLSSNNNFELWPRWEIEWGRTGLSYGRTKCGFSINTMLQLTIFCL